MTDEVCFNATGLWLKLWIHMHNWYPYRILSNVESRLKKLENKLMKVKTKNDLCAQQRLRLVWASAKSEWIYFGPTLPTEHETKTLNTCADAQVCLSLRWAQISILWFCHAAAQIIHKNSDLSQLSVHLDHFGCLSAFFIVRRMTCRVYCAGLFSFSLSLFRNTHLQVSVRHYCTHPPCLEGVTHYHVIVCG